MVAICISSVGGRGLCDEVEHRMITAPQFLVNVQSFSMTTIIFHWRRCQMVRRCMSSQHCCNLCLSGLLHHSYCHACGDGKSFASSGKSVVTSVPSTVELDELSAKWNAKKKNRNAAMTGIKGVRKGRFWG